MLIITRRPGEKLMIGDDVVIEVIEVSGSSVRIGIAAPKSIPVYREEIYSAVKAENTAAAAADPGQVPQELTSAEPSARPSS
ncbi:MAG: csrA [Solirubrobacterales bacterium]|nr:csrA [Solirubrobacterales bacterium]